MSRTSGKRLRRASVIIGILCLAAIVTGVSYFYWWQRTPAISAVLPPPPAPAPPPAPPPPRPEHRTATALRPRAHAGALLGKIEIPRLHVSTPILEGADESELKRGAGHVPSTALPGPSGNVAIAAHRDKFFRNLRFIEPKDEIVVHTDTGDYKYVVKSTEIVTPKDVSVLKQTTDPELTLITCYPFFFVGHAPKRFIVHAEGEPVLSASRQTEPDR